MVRICNNNSYPADHNEKYQEHFNTFPFPLSDFQKHSIEAIVDGHHSLVCCPTGSGKTLPAEFAIDFFTSRGKRVIYTSPLKALSNEKYYDFTRKYPHISIGLLTGDIKVNPEAQVLIMTAEILLNTLFMNKNRTPGSSVPLSFEMDFDTDLGCVIMDEIHFINDLDRGRVWEQTLMILPLHIQLIMLSATLDKPEKFAEWIESKYDVGGSVVGGGLTRNFDKKEVYLSTASTRIVPLTHYGFLAAPQALFKQIAKNEALCKEVKDLLGKPLQLQSAKGVFDEVQYHKIKKVLALLQEKNVYVKRQHVINEVCRYMVQNDMLPAVLFILSRKQIDTVSKEITVVLLEDDSKIPYIVHKECDEIIRKLPNYEEYKHLPEYTQMVGLLEKGIGIHHSGIIPILREMVEILFSKGYIKLLLATETFSVGLNMPIKTTVFTSLSKFDGTENRFFYSHEYMQCSGRAGRRGIDKIGTVIHLNNLFKPMTLPDYRLVMNGKPQTLISKFKISYNLILHLIHAGHENLVDFVKHSMLDTIIHTDMQSILYEFGEKEKMLHNITILMETVKTPKSVMDRYVVAEEDRKTAINKRRKELDREISNIREEWRTIDKDKELFLKFQDLEKEIHLLKRDLENTENFLKNSVAKILEFLEKADFIVKKEGKEKLLKFSKVDLGKVVKENFEECLKEKLLKFSKVDLGKVVEHSFEECLKEISLKLIKRDLEKGKKENLEDCLKKKLLKFSKDDLGKVVEYSFEELSRIDFEECVKEKLLKFSKDDFGKVVEDSFEELEKENIEKWLGMNIQKLLKENSLKFSKDDLGKVVEDSFEKLEKENIEKWLGMDYQKLFNEKFEKYLELELNDDKKLECKELTNPISLTQTGFIATQVKEVHCLVLANIYNELTAYSSKELIQLFSCFTNVTVDDEFKTLSYKNVSNKKIANVLEKVCTEYEKYMDFEVASRVETGMDNTLHYDLIHFIAEWFDAGSVDECKHVLQSIQAEKGIFLGEFVKAILKINSISAELENIAESLGHIEFLRTLKEIPAKTLKFVATSQSLYV